MPLVYRRCSFPKPRKKRCKIQESSKTKGSHKTARTSRAEKHAEKGGRHKAKKREGSDQKQTKNARQKHPKSHVKTTEEETERARRTRPGIAKPPAHLAPQRLARTETEVENKQTQQKHTHTNSPTPTVSSRHEVIGTMQPSPGQPDSKKRLFALKRKHKQTHNLRKTQTRTTSHSTSHFNYQEANQEAIIRCRGGAHGSPHPLSGPLRLRVAIPAVDGFGPLGCDVC